MVEVTVVDYGVGNLFSVQSALEHCGTTVTVTSDHTKILAAARVVLPGVGAFGNAMQELHRRDLVGVITEVARRGTPLLGICLGMQLLLDRSEEFGVTEGLGLIPGSVVPVPDQTVTGEAQKIPHIGWTALHPSANARWDGTVLQNTKPGDAVYFVHSFMAMPTDPSHRVAEGIYGGHNIAAVIARGNIVGCQFHPEKSGAVGLAILRTFCGV